MPTTKLKYDVEIVYSILGDGTTGVHRLRCRLEELDSAHTWGALQRAGKSRAEVHCVRWLNRPRPQG